MKDINLQPTDDGNAGSGPQSLADMNGTLYFAAHDGLTGFELWKSNGTEVGTVRVKDIQLGPLSSTPDGFALVNGLVVFAADGGLRGRELWVSNGTELGTKLLKDISAFGSSKPSYLTALPGGKAVLFAADDGVHGNELWITDGTEDGTQMVGDLNPGFVSSDPAPMSFDPQFTAKYVVSGGFVFFSAFNEETGIEPWAVPLSCVQNGLDSSCVGLAGQIPSDITQDEVLDITDGILLLNFLFGGESPRLPCGDGTGKDPANIALLDSNGDGGIDLSDAIRVFAYLFLGGAPPVLGTDCTPIAGCPKVCRG